MIEMAHIWDMVRTMRHNRLKNYIAPGLHSSLVGGVGNFGKVRVFEAERYTRDLITPHSHRFPFTCLVLSGEVENTIYEPLLSNHRDSTAEKWIRSKVTQVCGPEGVREFTHVREEVPKPFRRAKTTYPQGSTYTMTHDQIHSIVFHANTKALFFEGPEVQDWDWMLEPYVDGKLVPTFETRPWMFERE